MLERFRQRMQQGEKSGGSGRKRPLDLRSFFSWFCDHGDPSADEIAEVRHRDPIMLGIVLIWVYRNLIGKI